MPKLLAEFLEEQQEPFALDAYLLERGYSIKKSSRFFKRRRAIPNCSRFVNAVFRFVLHSNHNVKVSGNASDKDEGDFTSQSGTTQYNSCSGSDVEDIQSSENGVLEADEDRRLNWRSMEEGNKQLSPVSVLEETESEEGSPLHQKQCKSKTIRGECSTSIPQRKPTHNSVEKIYKVDHSNPYEQYMINKRALQQKKQLLIDCVREVIENHRKRDDKKGQQLKKILGSEELWKLVCENVWVWSQDSINQTNILHLLQSDFMASVQDWDSAFAQQKEEICVGIGDAILEDVINEIVMS